MKRLPPLKHTRRLPGHSKHPRVTAALRGKIMANQWPPQQQLPSAVALARRFKTTKLTVLRSLADLQEAGYIRTEPGRGTFVADHPPHRSHYALAFPFRQDQLYSQFFVALHQEALKLQRRDRRITEFYEIEQHVDVEDYQRLLGFVRRHRVAGVIFAHHPFLLHGSPLVTEAGIPRVAVMQPDPSLSMPSVYPALDQFIPRALERLAAQGCRRVALLSLTTAGTTVASKLEEFQTHAAARGLTVHPHWVQAVHPETTDWAKPIIALLFHRGQKESPDALVITDDNLVPDATAGLLAAGGWVPAEVAVVAQTNFPWPTASAVPVIRLGYAIGQVINTCLERIDQQRRGETPPAHTAISPVFEEEIPHHVQPTLVEEFAP